MSHAPKSNARQHNRRVDVSEQRGLSESRWILYPWHLLVHGNNNGGRIMWLRSGGHGSRTQM
eukprot:3419832-Rhodomonas_salina.2